jgi:hypothetical protein
VVVKTAAYVPDRRRSGALWHRIAERMLLGKREGRANIPQIYGEY